MEPIPDTPLHALAPTLDRLRAAWHARKPPLDQRRDDLHRLRRALVRGQDAMEAAIRADFGHRARAETLISEVAATLGELDNTRHHLDRWARPRRVGVGWKFWPARARLQPSPLGVVGIISPWNYPVNLALVPLVSAIAAGNHVYVKPSEQVPRTSAWLRDLLADVFPDDRVAVALGGPEVGAAFAALPFDHLLFTGSTAVGRKVLAAAAPNLTPVTLELGGKAPALVAPDYPLAQAAARIASGKWFNAGQTCIGVDHALIDASRRDAFVDALRAEVRARFGDLSGEAPHYTRIVNAAQYERLQGYLADARARGCTVLALAAVDPERGRAERLLPPTLVLDPPDDADLMRHEIFGPILPVLSYRTLDEALAMLGRHGRPLAMYPFSNDRATVDRIIDATLAGGITVNDTLVQFGVHALPFGGVGTSGMGAIHGRAGFETFSKLLPVMHQSRWAATDLLRPPYRGLSAKLIRLLTR